MRYLKTAFYSARHPISPIPSRSSKTSETSTLPTHGSTISPTGVTKNELQVALLLPFFLSGWVHAFPLSLRKKPSGLSVSPTQPNQVPGHDYSPQRKSKRVNRWLPRSFE